MCSFPMHRITLHRRSGSSVPAEGAILVCDVVYAELVPAFGDRSALDRALRRINATTAPLDTAIAYEAGLRSRYRQAGGPSPRIMSDFLIGAHAVVNADTFPVHHGSLCPGVTTKLNNGLGSPPDHVPEPVVSRWWWAFWEIRTGHPRYAAVAAWLPPVAAGVAGCSCECIRLPVPAPPDCRETRARVPPEAVPRRTGWQGSRGP